MSDDLVNLALAELGEVVRCRCHEAYKDRGLHDPNCECDSAEAVKVVEDRIEELEAELAYWKTDSAAAWDKCEERRLENARLREAQAWQQMIYKLKARGTYKPREE